MVSVSYTKCSYPGAPDCVTTSLFCSANASNFYGPPYATLQSQFPSVKTKAISDLNSLFNTVASRVDSASADQFDDVAASVVSQWNTSIGSNNTGILGAFYLSVNQLVSAAYKTLQQLLAGNKCELKGADTAQTNFTAGINNLNTAATSEISATISSLTTKLNSRIDAAAVKLFPARLKVFTDAFESGLVSLESSAVTVDDFANGVTNLSNSLSSKISSVKYPGSEAQDAVTVAMTALNDKVKASSGRVYSSMLGTSLTAIRSDISSRASMIQSTFDSSVAPIRDSAIADISKFASPFVDNIIANAHVPSSVVDSSSLRSFWNDFKRSSSSAFTSAANDKFSVFQNKLKAPLSSYSSSRDALVGYYNDKLQSSVISSSDVESQLDSINTVVSKLFTDLDSHIQSTIKSASNAVYDSIVASRQVVSSRLNEFVSSYPILRFTGEYSIPTRIGTDSPTTFSFTVKNIGGSPWSGWFGVKIVGDQGGVWKYNDQSSALLYLSPGTTQSFSVSAPFNTILAGTTFPSSVKGFILVNTKVS